jgi:hypothetical protein
MAATLASSSVRGLLPLVVLAAGLTFGALSGGRLR